MKFLQAFIFILVISIGVFAQATGTLTGQVVDSVGAIIPNATVTVTNGSGVERTATANNSGQFTITGLPSGTYTVRVGATDFAPYENTEVVVAAGQRAELIVTLTIAEVQAEVEISSEGQVNTDAENNKSALVLKGEDLESLPEDPDELAAALQALAGPSAGPNGGQFFIDGFSGGRLPPRESIREIRINQNPFSSEYDRLGFGRVEILTKPGSSKFRGQAFFNFNDEILNSRNPFAANRAQTQTRFYGGNISGPIIKNKASYFFDIDNRQIDDNAVVNATILDANLNPTLFSEAFVVPIRRFSISPRFDYALNEQNTLVVRYGFTRNKADNRGLGGFSLPSRAFETSNTQHNFQLTETAILSPTIVNETRFQYNRERNQQNGNSSIPTINVADAFTGGGSNIGLNFNNEDRFELQNYTTTGFGKHSLKFGARLRSVFQKDRSESNFGGTFTFTSLEQYRQTILGNLRPTQFIITSGDPLVDVSQTDFSLFANDDWRVRPDLTLSLGLRYEIQNNINDRFNFAPRFGFAYSPGAGGAKQPKTVFRGGFGIFYDRIGENLTLQEERFNGQRQLQYTVSGNNNNAFAILQQPIFTASGVTNVPTAAQVAALVPGSATIRRMADDLRSPYTMQGAFSVERQLPFRSTFSVTFIATRTNNLLRTRNINAPMCPSPVSCQGQPLVRPIAGQGNIFQFESTGRLDQQQLIFGFNSRLSQKLTIFSNYRLGRAKSDTDGLGTFPLYSYDLSNEYGDAALDVRHNLVLGGQLTLPFDIRLNPFVIASSGRPFNIITGVDSNGDTQFTERPAFATDLSRPSVRLTEYGAFDINPLPGQVIIPRNYGRGPSFFNVNLNAGKTFGFGGSRRQTVARPQGTGGGPAIGQTGGGAPPFGGAGGGRGGRGGGGGGQGAGASDSPYSLTFTVQVQNLLNINNQGQPIGNLSSTRFGQSTSTAGGFGFFGGGGGGGGFGGGGGNAGNRRVQLQVRFNF